MTWCEYRRTFQAHRLRGWAAGSVLALAAVACLASAAPADAAETSSLAADARVDGNDGDQLGSAVAAASDMNGNSRAELVIGAGSVSNVNGHITGEVYVLFDQQVGGGTGVAASSAKGFRIVGAPSRQIGYALDGGGDVNGDGRGDVAVGAWTAEYPDRKGAVWVVFGSSSVAPVDLGELGTRGFRINGARPDAGAGLEVAVIDDMNGDELDEVALVERDPYQRMKAWVVFGRRGTSTIDLANLGSGGFVITNDLTTKSDFWRVGRAGDVNSDGRGDLVLGGDGGTYVVFGKSGNASVATSTLGTGGYRIANADNASGTDIGDLNGDGRSDLALGHTGAAVDGKTAAGRAIVVWGQSSSTTLDANNLGAGGYVINGSEPYQYVGADIDGAGDVNGDGKGDVFIGAPGTPPGPERATDPPVGGEGRSGAAYLIYGKSTTTNQSLLSVGEAGVMFRNDEYEIQTANNFGGDVSGGWLGHEGVDGALAIGNSYSDNAGRNAGSTYVWNAPVDVPSPVAVTGIPQDGQELEALVPSGVVADSFQWYSCRSEIWSARSCDLLIGATDAKILLREWDVERRIAVEVKTASQGILRSEATAPVKALPPLPAGRPQIIGVAGVSETLETAAAGVFGGTPATSFAYQWLRCAEPHVDDINCVAIPGATAWSYTPTALESGARLRVRVTATNSEGSAAMVSTASEFVGQAFPEPGAVAPTRVVPTENEEEEIAAAKNFRAMLGLRADDAYVRALETDPELAASREEWGVALKPLEERDLVLRGDIASAAGVIDTYGAARDTYAGYSIRDTSDGSTIVVRFTENATLEGDALLRVFGYPSRLSTASATYSLRQLEAVAGDVAESPSPAPDHPANFVQIDEGRNRVEVGVTGRTDAVEQQYRDRFGPSVVVIEGAPTRLISGRGSRQRLRGGIRIFEKGNTSGNDDCTSGFNGHIYNTYGGTRIRAMVTAGHCSNAYTTYTAGRINGGAHHHNKETWLQHDRLIGETNESTINSGHPNQQGMPGQRKTDGVTIFIENADDATNYVYTGPRRVRRVTRRTTDNSDRGAKVCVSRGYGPRKRNTCGKVQRRFVLATSPNGRKVYDSRVIDGARCPAFGDSGSPVYGIRGRGEAEAVGIVFGSQDEEDTNDECVYSGMRNLGEELTFQPYTTETGGPGQP